MKTEMPEVKNIVPVNVNAIFHKVTKLDTVMSLSIKYGVPMSKIKHVNNIHTDNIQHKKEVIIPNPSKII